MEVWNTEGVSMNATAENILDPSSEIFLFEGGFPTLEFFVGEDTEFDIEVTGTIESTDSIEVHGQLMFFRHMEPDSYTDYPYRIYGGAIALLGFFASTRVPVKERKKQDA